MRARRISLGSIFKTGWVLVTLLLIPVWVVYHLTRDRLPEGMVELRYGMFGTDEQKKQEYELIRRFETAHPNIRVKLEWCSSGNYLLKLKTQIAGRTEPDVTWMGAQYVEEFATRDAFLALDPVIAADPSFRLDQYFPVMVNAFRSSNGALYGIPKDNSPTVLFYNQDAFEKAGIPLPHDGWTWEECIAAGKKLTRDTNGDGMPDQFGYIALWDILYFYQHGCWIFSGDGKRALFDTPEAIQAMKFRRDLAYTYKITPSPTQTAVLMAGSGGGLGLGAFDLFPAERVMMLPCNPAITLYFNKVCRFKWSVAPMPKGPLDLTIVDGAAYPILARTKHLREAWEFVKFLAGPEVQEMRVKAGDSLPSLMPIAGKYLSEMPEGLKVGYRVLDRSRSLPKHEKWGRMEADIFRAFERIMTDENPTPPEVELPELNKKLQKIIDDPLL